MKKLFTLFMLAAFSFSANAGDRFLIHIGADGKQEAIPLKKGERAQDAIARMANQPSVMTKSAGLIDTLKYYVMTPNDGLLTSNFGWTHQDVGFQWYTPAADGRVKEFWWRNYNVRGNINKGTIRAWLVDPKLATRPSSVLTKFFGYYKDPTDGDGLVTPYKPAAGGNQWFYGNGGADSATYRFDPLGSEVPTWIPGSGLQVTLDSAKWQGIKLEDWGDSMSVKLGEMFGFTLSNDTKKSDIPAGGTDERMEILSFPNTNPAPYHSFKWYEGGRSAPGTDNGWHMRGDYEWGFYVVIEYTGDRPPKITPNTYSTTLKTTSRSIVANITDDNPGGGNAGVASARLFSKKGVLAAYDSAAMSAAGATYTGTAPGGAAGDTIFWYVVATDVNGNRSKTSPFSYKIFKKTQERLLIYNNAQYSLAVANLIYTNSSTKYDRWSGPTDGTGEMADLLALYTNVLLADGSFPSRNVYPAVSAWLAEASATKQRNLFFTSQDYGCYITPSCGDTTFAAGTFENMLGVTTLGPQDQGATNRPVKVVPVADTLTNYIIKFNTDSATTLWHYPTFELAFAAYPDFFTKTASAKTLFTDPAGTGVYGVKNSGTGFNTMFLALDPGALQFRGDTSLHNAGYTTVTDPKYNWLVDVGPLPNKFFDWLVSVKPVNNVVPGEFALGQNYPNPFNPSTQIEYFVPVRSNVSIAIFNILGQKVATIVNDMHEAGSHRATWNGKDSFGKQVASGIYFYQMHAGSFEQVKKMMLMK